MFSPIIFFNNPFQHRTNLRKTAFKKLIKKYGTLYMKIYLLNNIIKIVPKSISPSTMVSKVDRALQKHQKVSVSGKGLKCTTTI